MEGSVLAEGTSPPSPFKDQRALFSTTLEHWDDSNIDTEPVQDWTDGRSEPSSSLECPSKYELDHGCAFGGLLSRMSERSRSLYADGTRLSQKISLVARHRLENRGQTVVLAAASDATSVFDPAERRGVIASGGVIVLRSMAGLHVVVRCVIESAKVQVRGATCGEAVRIFVGGSNQNTVASKLEPRR
ncbi:hypothetical protein C8J57DRAFT_1260734 [Mycena rebaudengoi]|nr:hypothetical protein C8J57DRAFT_1260734 [Mycena rebaudengoi]